MLKSHWIQSAVLVLSFAAGATAASAQSSTAVHPAHGRSWRETRLYFGLGPADAPDKGVSDAQWRAFLDSEVTPRFPSGLSVADLYGQWRSKPGDPVERLRSKVLILDYPENRANGLKVEAIRTAWKRQTGDVSVLRVTQAVDVSF